MKETLKQKTKEFLAWATRKVIAKYKPKIIGITGSVGKTSAKEAIFSVVSQKYQASRPIKNFNNEFGLPFAVLGIEGASTTAGWIFVILRVLGKVYFSGKFPQVLVLEMGIDHPHDMDYLLSLTGPLDIGVLTNIGMSHSEFFSNVEDIAVEKSKMIAGVKESGFSLLNADNSKVMQQKGKARGKVITYGTAPGSDIRLENYTENLEGKVSSHFQILRPTGPIEVSIPAVGKTHVSAILAAVSVAQALRVEDSLIKKGLESYRAVPGRLNLIAGIKRSILIDDTYNAAPDSMREAIELLSRMPNQQKIAVLGNMLELGAESEDAHEEIGKLVATKNFAHLVTVGEQGKLLADAAIAAGMPEDKVLKFDTADEARKTVQEIMKPESAVLIKGSQGVRMEKITREVMAEPTSAASMLCRQEPYWLNN